MRGPSFARWLERARAPNRSASAFQGQPFQTAQGRTVVGEAASERLRRRLRHYGSKCKELLKDQAWTRPIYKTWISPTGKGFAVAEW